MASDSCCLFVRNLTKDTTREELTKLFSEDYVIKHAIVIHERHGGPSKGFGFVTFALASDVREALERDNFSLKGNKLKLAIAANNQGKEESAAAPADGGAAAAAAPVVVDWKTRKDERRKTPAMLDLEKRTVVLFGVGSLTESQLRKRLKKRAGGTVESIANFKEDGDESIKQVVYANADAVNGAVKEINGRSWGSAGEEADEHKPNVVYARRFIQVSATPHQRSKSRLICRNLAFSVTKEEMMGEFAKFGPVEEVVVNAKGFGFVQFYCRTDAEKAVEEVNGTTVLGPLKPSGKRGVVAVDFALTKDHYEKVKAKEEEQEQEAAKAAQEAAEEAAAAAQEEEASSSEEDEDDDSSNQDDDEDDDDSSNQDDDEDDDQDDDDDEPAPEAAPIVVHGGDKGVRDKRTLFVRNLLFETTEETIRERFKEFGKVRGVKLCRDATQRSRGLGFVEFWDAESCDKVLSNANPKTGATLLLEGRELYCNLAVDKNQAQGLKQLADKADEKEDKRHLHLVKVGRVPPNQVPASDAKKREYLEEETKTKLRNPLFYVSQTRLSVKNLCRKPTETPDSKTLRSVFKACAIRGLKERLVIEPAPRTSVRVLKATVFQEEGKEDVPSGFGFVEMSSHAHALAAIKVLNNNPEFSYLAGGGKQSMKLPEDKRPRLIVSFAIENGAKVRAQQLRAKESMLPGKPKRAKPSSGTDGGSGGGDDKEKRREQRRLEKKAQPPTKKVREHLDDKPAAPAAFAPEAKNEPFANRVQKKVKPLTNRAFERGTNRARNTDEFDQLMSKRSKLFEDAPGGGGSADAPVERKRWFDE